MSKKTKLPVAVDHVVCAALNLADIKMTPDQRDLADRTYELASALESTYTDLQAIDDEVKS
jgi:hypothetical protein